MGTVRKIPMRKCVGCSEKKEKKELIRVLRTPEGEILLDATGRQNGRGAYLCRNTECFRKAVRSRGLERSLGISIPEELTETLEKEISGLEQ
ncbi:MAG: YlxR family protein [Lachnospiraceae bacterium]|nr:YlxR family protein [Lachnospiraceae bacterium]